MIELSLAAAFVGGLLALLSPCSALLLPAFLAYAVASPRHLLGRTLLFLLGLCTVYLPLGLGAGLAGALLLEHRDTTILLAGLALVALGVLTLAGRGLHSLPMRLADQPTLAALPAAYGAGVVYGLGGACSGPLLGAALTVAGAAGDPALGAALLAAYALGTAAPLFGLAWLWDRRGLAKSAWLQGRELRLGPWRGHTTSVLAGLLTMLLGVAFIVTEGGARLTTLYADLGLEWLGYRAQVWVASAAWLVDWPWLVALAVLAARWLYRRARRTAALPAPVARRQPR